MIPPPLGLVFCLVPAVFVTSGGAKNTFIFQSSAVRTKQPPQKQPTTAKGNKKEKKKKNIKKERSCLGVVKCLALLLCSNWESGRLDRLMSDATLIISALPVK